MKFLIRYVDAEGVEQEDEVEFHDTTRWGGSGRERSISAREWAEDYAYSAADKGHYEIEEIRADA